MEMSFLDLRCLENQTHSLIKGKGIRFFISPKTDFETEGKGNSEMASYVARCIFIHKIIIMTNNGNTTATTTTIIIIIIIIILILLQCLTRHECLAQMFLCYLQRRNEASSVSSSQKGNDMDHRNESK